MKIHGQPELLDGGEEVVHLHEAGGIQYPRLSDESFGMSSQALQLPSPNEQRSL